MTMPSDEPSDEDLVRDFQSNGCMDGLNILFGRHMTRIRKLIQPMVLDVAAADDLAQEACIRAARALPGFGHRAKFSTWLNRIAVNTALMYLRSRKSAPRFEEQSELENFAAGGGGPREGMIAGETDAAVSRALAKLPPDLRAAVSLTCIEGLSASEAAKAAGCLTATMYWRVHQGRSLLKKSLREYLT